MVLSLLPPVAFGALHPVRTASFLDGFDFVIFLPVGAVHVLVMMFLGVAAIVLNIMRVVTEGSVVVGGDGAPNRLIRIKVEF